MKKIYLILVIAVGIMAFSSVGLNKDGPDKKEPYKSDYSKKFKETPSTIVPEISHQQDALLNEYAECQVISVKDERKNRPINKKTKKQKVSGKKCDKTFSLDVVPWRV